ncbi:MAG: OmpA family protein [Thermodesulfobacteriota bacterium]
MGKIIFGSVLAIAVTAMFLVFSMQKSAQLTLDKEGLEHSIQQKDKEIQAAEKKLETAVAEAASVKAENAVIPELQTSIETAENEKQGLLQQVGEMKQQLDSAARLEEEHARQRQQLAQVEEAKSSAESQTAVTEKQLAELQHTLENQSGQVQQFAADLEQKDRVIKILKEQLDDSGEKMSLLQSSTSTDRLNLNLILDELAVKSTMVDELSKRIVLLGGSSDVVPSEVETEIAKQREEKAKDQELIAKLTLENDSLKTLVSEQGTHITELSQEVKDSGAVLESKTTIIDELQQASGAAQEELEQLRLNASSKEQQITELQASLTDNQASLENVKTEAVATAGPLNEKIAALEQQLAEATANNLTLTQGAEQSEDSLGALLQKNEELNTELAFSKSTLDEAEVHITQLKESLQTAEESLQEGAAAQQKLSSEMEPVMLALTESEEKHNSLNSQYQQLEEELAALKAEKEQQGDLSQELTTVQAALDAAREEQAQSVAQGTAMQEELDTLKAASSEKDNSIQDLETQLNSAREQLAGMESAAAEESSKQQAGQEERTKLEQRIAELIAEVGEAKAVAESQTTSIKVQEEELATLKGQSTNAAALEEDNRQLAATLTQLQDELEKNREEMTGLQSSVSSLEEERDQLLLYTRDSDNDGISDAEDKCPDTEAGVKVNGEGCEEDSDQDGMVNRLDLCPDTESGSKANAIGCSDDQQTVVLEGIKFQLGTSKLTVDAQSALTHAATILQNNPDVRMEVAGHTDSIGEPASNLRLSTNRAKSVLGYLVTQGVAEEQLQAKGYGSEAPIGDNATESGRAQNRRVELRRIAAGDQGVSLAQSSSEEPADQTQAETAVETAPAE